MTTVKYDFPRETAVAINSGQATSIVIQGNIYDLFFIKKDSGFYLLNKRVEEKETIETLKNANSEEKDC